MLRVTCVLLALSLAHCLPAPSSDLNSRNLSQSPSEPIAAKEPKPLVRHLDPNPGVNRLLVVKKQPCVQAVDKLCDKDFEYEFDLLVDRTKSGNRGKLSERFFI